MKLTITDINIDDIDDREELRNLINLREYKLALYDIQNLFRNLDKYEDDEQAAKYREYINTILDRYNLLGDI